MFLQKFVQSAARGGFAAWRRGAALLAASTGLSFAFGAATVDLAELSGDVILADGDVATGELGGPYKVSIDAGATVTLSDVIITNSASSSTPWAGITCLGDATIILKEETAVNACNEYTPGILVPQSCTLTIKGDGWLNAEGGRLGGAGIGGGAYGLNGGNIVIDIDDVDGCYVDAVGGGFAAGIGGGLQSDFGCIIISNGVVIAEGSAGGAGIGSGNGGTCGDITICGGDVYATGGDGGSGVGSGNAGDCGDITIVGGKVEATGGDNAAGIGSGDGTSDIASCGDITIGPKISVVDATCGDGCTNPIGAGVDGACGEVSVYRVLVDDLDGTNRYLYRNDINLADLTEELSIDANATLYGELDGLYKITIADGVTVLFDGVVVTNGVSVADDDEYSWAGITLEGSAEIILAEGSTNIVKGFHRNYPGIEVPDVGELTISGSGTLEASSNGAGAGIGGAAVDEDGDPGMVCGDIVIEDGDITAIGGDSAAGIGGAYNGSCGDITINGGKVTATGGGGAAGIGGGEECYINSIGIYGGVVVAVGGLGGAGIGGGQGEDAYVDTITINGGKVTATGGGGAAGIGGGEEAEINYIEIYGGVVVAAGGSGGAGIGGGRRTDAIGGAEILINGGTVTATGGAGAPGIGGMDSVVTVAWDITRVVATCGDGAAKPIDVGNDDDIDIDERLIDKLSADGKTRTLTGTGGDEDKWYETWAEANGLTGDDAKWDAAPAAWGGEVQNAFVFLYGEGILDGSTPLMTITIDDDGDPVIETTSELPGREGFFTPAVVGTSALDDWTSPIELEGDDSGVWYLPAGESANFFRLRLTEK